MPHEAEVKMIRDEEFIQEGEVTLTVDNLAEVKNSIAVLNKLRRQAIEELEIGNDEDEEGTAVTSVEFRVEGDKVIAHVTQGLID
jgi:hypothetical protein